MDRYFTDMWARRSFANELSRAEMRAAQTNTFFGRLWLGINPLLLSLVYFLLVVAIGGAGTIKGGRVAALILGICDVAGKYYVPQVGSFIIYFLMVALMMLFPAGLYGRRT